MTISIDMGGAGEHLGIVIPDPTGASYQFRVSVNLPQYISITGHYAPLGNSSRCDIFSYLRGDHDTCARLPGLPSERVEYRTPHMPLISEWVNALNLEALLEPSAPGNAYAPRPMISELWLPVTVRPVPRELNCAYRPWTDLLCQFLGRPIVLVYDTY